MLNNSIYKRLSTKVENGRDFGITAFLVGLAGLSQAGMKKPGCMCGGGRVGSTYKVHWFPLCQGQDPPLKITDISHSQKCPLVAKTFGIH